MFGPDDGNCESHPPSMPIPVPGGGLPSSEVATCAAWACLPPPAFGGRQTLGVRVSETIGAYDIAAVRAAFVSDEVKRDFAARVGVEMNRPVEIVVNVEATDISMTWQLDTRQFELPSMVRNALPSTATIEWSETWTEGLTGSVTVLSRSGPTARFTGASSLSVSDGLVEYRVEGRAKVSIPLVGGTFASMIEEHLVAPVLKDHADAVRAYLSALG